VFFATKHDLGLYALGMFATSFLIIPSGIFQAVLSPRVMRLVNKDNDRDGRALLEASLILHAAIITPIVLFCLPLIDLVLRHYLSKYFLGRSAAFVLCTLVLTRGSVMILRAHYLSLNRELFLVRMQLAFAALTAVVDVLFLMNGYGVDHIAAATASVYLLFSIVVHVDFAHGSLRKELIARLVVHVLGLGLIVAAAALLLHRQARATLLGDAVAGMSWPMVLIGLWAMICYLIRGRLARATQVFRSVARHNTMAGARI